MRSSSINWMSLAPFLKSRNMWYITRSICSCSERCLKQPDGRSSKTTFIREIPNVRVMRESTPKLNASDNSVWPCWFDTRDHWFIWRKINTIFYKRRSLYIMKVICSEGINDYVLALSGQNILLIFRYEHNREYCRAYIYNV